MGTPGPGVHSPDRRAPSPARSPRFRLSSALRPVGSRSSGAQVEFPVRWVPGRWWQGGAGRTSAPDLPCAGHGGGGKTQSPEASGAGGRTSVGASIALGCQCRVGDLGYGKDKLETCLSLAFAETRFSLPGQRCFESVRGEIRAELCPHRVWSGGLVGPGEGGCLGRGEACVLSLLEEAF